jgi:hypothetical protein
MTVAMSPKPHPILSHIQGRISGHEHPCDWFAGTNIKITPGTITHTISVDQVAARHAGPNYDDYQDWSKAAGAPLRSADNPDTKGVGLREGTPLDHTVQLLGGSQISRHSGGSFPMLLAGGRKLGFKHGQHVKWKGNPKPASDLYLTILRQMGRPAKPFKKSAGPSPKFWRNHVLECSVPLWKPV